MPGKYLTVVQRASVVALKDEGVYTSDVACPVGCCDQTVRIINSAYVTDLQDVYHVKEDPWTP